MKISSRLHEEQLATLRYRAEQFHKQIVKQGKAKGFSEIFRLAALRIEADVDSFYELAEELFEEIEAYGKEPKLDEDWLYEVTGERDTFYFSTENLLTEPLPIDRGRGQQHKESTAEEKAEVVEEVEQAVQSFEEAIGVSHSEDVERWIEKIAIALRKKNNRKQERMEFWQLQQETQLSASALFLGLLLGHTHWSIHQEEGFYSKVFVSLT